MYVRYVYPLCFVKRSSLDYGGSLMLKENLTRFLFESKICSYVQYVKYPLCFVGKIALLTVVGGDCRSICKDFQSPQSRHNKEQQKLIC